MSKLIREIYEKFYKNYTIKQWGKDQVSKTITGRLPIRFNRNPYYVNEKNGFMPKRGFTNMFINMTKNPKIKIMLNTDFFKIRKDIQFNKFLIYTGTPDKFFNYKWKIRLEIT